MKVTSIIVFTTLAALSLLFGSAAFASGTATPLDPSIQIGIGTLGLAANITGNVSNNIVVRIGGSVGSLSHNQTESGIDYSGNLKFQCLDGLVDIYPGKSSALHFTVGLIDNTTKATATATGSGGSINIGGTSYTTTSGESLGATVTWSGTKPYIGIGFGRPARKSGKLYFFGDFGAILSDTGRVTLVNNGIPGVTSGDLATQQATTQSDLNKVSFYPVAMLGLGVTF